MSDFAAGANAAPSFASAAACREWLAGAPLTDAAQMVALLLREVTALNRATLPAGERLEILELLRGPIHECQDAFGRRFVGKPQPLADAERSAFDTSSALWHTLVTGYMRCAEACFAGDPQVKSKTALVLERALVALGAQQLDTHRVNRAPGAEHWRLLHQMFASAEQFGVATQEVADAVHLGKLKGSPQAAYVEALLLGMSNLHECSQRQIGWAARWARRWAPKIKMLAEAPQLSSQSIPLCVDLASELAPGYRPFTGPGARWLDTGELRHSIKKRLALLAQGEPPAKLNLGTDCPQPACGELLTALYGRWCKGAAVRAAERRPASGRCRFVAGVEAVHYYVAGRKPFKRIAPTDLRTLRREQEEIATFGRVATHRDEHFSEQAGYAVEEWQAMEEWHAINTSSAGVRIARPLVQPGARVGHHQLVAVTPPEAQDWLLGWVRWTLVSERLEAGISLFPGRPEAIAARGSGISAANEPFRPVFVLPGIDAIGQPPSIVLPVGMFKTGRVLDTYSGRPGRLRVTRLLERGADFERAVYEPA